MLEMPLICAANPTGYVTRPTWIDRPSLNIVQRNGDTWYREAKLPCAELLDTLDIEKLYQSFSIRLTVSLIGATTLLE